MNGIKNTTPSIKDIEELLSPTEMIERGFHNKNINFLYGPIDEDSVKKIIQWIVFENCADEKITGNLTLYINSPGGELYQAFALIDVMRASRIPIRTIGIGAVMSAAFLIFCSGEKGQRIIGKNTGIMCHQYSDEIGGKHHDIKSHMKEADNCNDRMINILLECSDLDLKAIKSKLLNSSDVWLKSEEMLSFGLADEIL